MRKGIIKGLMVVLMALCMGVFAGNVSLYSVSAEEANAGNSATETTQEQKNLIRDSFNVIDAVIPTTIQAMFPQEFKETVRGCVGSVGGVAGSVALGLAAIALLKKKKD